MKTLHVWNWTHYRHVEANHSKAWAISTAKRMKCFIESGKDTTRLLRQYKLNK